MNIPNKIYDLENRTYNFAKDVRSFIQIIPKRITNLDDCKQLIRSSGSVGANYIEANNSLSKKDFIMRIKISKKEAKESIYWLNLITIENKSLEDVRIKLIKESTELMKILGSILVKTQHQNPSSKS